MAWHGMALHTYVSDVFHVKIKIFYFFIGEIECTLPASATAMQYQNIKEQKEREREREQETNRKTLYLPAKVGNLSKGPREPNKPKHKT